MIAKAPWESDNSRLMTLKDSVVVVLAAGKGTRLRSDIAKVLHRAGGRPLVEHVVRACLPLKAAAIYVIVGHQADEVGAAVAPFGVKTVLQQPQRGTGHAMQVARAATPSSARYAIVLPGDAPLIRVETLAALAQTHTSSGASATILTAKLEDPSGYGRIIRKTDGTVAAIVEEKAANESLRAIREINSGIYCFTLKKLWPCLEELRPDNAHRELYLTDVIAALNQRGEKVVAQLSSDPREILGCNTRAELAEVDRLFRRRKAAALMEAGVTIYLPETVIIDAEVVAGQDTVIEPCVQLLGKTRLGVGCIVRTGSVLIDSELEDSVIVEPHSVLDSCRLAGHAVVGPFARLRPGAELREGARVGNFVEVKNAVLHEGAKALHLTYLGDASIGRATNIGAGTITCNYDGVRKNRTTIGERVFIGSDTALVAPVEVGDRAYVAAGSTITENVPADALGIARGRQVNKPGWAAERRTKMEAQRATIASEKPAAKSASARSSHNPGSAHHPTPNPANPKPRRKKPAARKRRKTSRHRGS